MEDTTSAMMTIMKNQQWMCLKHLRSTDDPTLICSPESIPRLAKDETYATDLLQAWNKDYQENQKEAEQQQQDNEKRTKKSSAFSSYATSSAHDEPFSSSRSLHDSYGSVFPYKGSDGEEYGGYLVVPQHLYQRNFEVSHNVPVIIMFHTGAGPQDIFNRYQADKLAREEIWSDTGCIVFIADIIQDTIGWSWGNRERYWAKRKDLLSVGEKDGVKKRYNLQATLSSIMEAVRSIDIADTSRVAVIGFCLGGQPTFELGRMQFDEILGLVTFHGLFDGVTSSDVNDPKGAPKERSPSWESKPREVLICNGKGDPLVPESDLQCARKKFEDAGYNVNVLNFEHAQHNFSNPRTKYDDPDSPFAYNKHADTVSWNETIKLFAKIFQLKQS